MSILVDFNNIGQRLADFESEQFQERYQGSPLLRGLSYTLIAMEWEGTPELLSDAFMPGESDSDGFEATLTRLGYQCRTTKYEKAKLEATEGLHLPCFIELDKLEAILLSVRDGEATLFDYKNNNSVTVPLVGNTYSLTVISEYSKLFREPPPESQDKSNWIKYAFYRYNDEFKSLVFLSLVINIFGALQPFFHYERL